MGQHRTAGKQTETLKIGEKIYTLRPLTFGIYAEFEDWIVSEKIDPIEALAARIDKVPPQHQAAAWEAAINAAQRNKTITTTEMAAAENSLRGVAWKLWKVLEKDHPEVRGVDDALKLVAKMGEDRVPELVAKMQVASGELDLKNSDGPAAT